MADGFGISQIMEYLTQMGLKVAHVDQELEILELAFHGNTGQWRMIVGFQQKGDVRKLMLIAPHIGSISTKKRLQCLEALMAVNYRIAMGKFGLDLEDGEVRLEESIPIASHTLTFEQFQLAFGAMVQTVAMYHSLIPRIIYSNLSVQDALQACERDFFEEHDSATSRQQGRTEELPELDVNDVLAEVTRLFEERQD